MSGFSGGESMWMNRLGGLRDRVRQELVTRQLRSHLPPPPAAVLDVGCGQGTQTMQLAGRGYEVVAIDSSQRLLGVLRDSLRSDDAIAARVETIDGEISALPELVSGTTFDVVLCHGVLMYFDDPEPVLDLLADRVEAGGVLSLLVRNRDSLAMRPGTAGRWSEALAAFDATTYVNRLGVQARADRLEDLEAGLARRGLSLSAWYGVRVFTDNAVSGKTPPSSHDLLEIIAAEERAGATDPYRAVAPLLHLVSRRTGGGHESH